MAVKAVNEPVRELLREPVRHTGEQRKERSIRGCIQPSIYTCVRPSPDGRVMMSHERNLHESSLVRQKSGTPGNR